jgi:hypothetical protein
MWEVLRENLHGFQMYDEIVRIAKEHYILIFDFFKAYFNLFDLKARRQLEMESIFKKIPQFLKELKGTIDNLAQRNLFIPLLQT